MSNYSFINCTNCNKQFTKRNIDIKRFNTHFCTIECHKLYRTKIKQQKIQNAKCKYCGKQLDKSEKKFCNQSCSASYNNKNVQHNKPKIRTCNKCNIEYTIIHSNNSSKNLCSKCVNDYNTRTDKTKNLTLKDYCYRYKINDKHQSLKYAHIRQFARSWLKDLKNKPCAICGYDKHVELHHIKPISEFDDDATLGEINSSKNVVQLCPNCHWEVDNNITKL